MNIHQIIRVHSGGTGLWIQTFHDYQAALDELAALYQLNSSAWGPQCSEVSFDRKKRVLRVIDNDPQPTFLVTYFQ